MPTWISRAEHARRAFVSRPAVTQWARRLDSAAKKNALIDASHPAVVDHRESGEKREKARLAKAERAAKKAAAKAPKRGSKRAKTAAEKPPKASRPPVARVEDYLELTLREIAERFETDAKAPAAFVKWVDVQKKLEDTRKTRLDNDETEGALIRRELVSHHIVAPLDGLFRRLLGDTSRAIAARCYAAAKSGQPLHEAEGVVRELTGKQLAAVKAKLLRVLRNA